MKLQQRKEHKLKWVVWLSGMANIGAGKLVNNNCVLVPGVEKNEKWFYVSRALLLLPRKTWKGGGAEEFQIVQYMLCAMGYQIMCEKVAWMRKKSMENRKRYELHCWK